MIFFSFNLQGGVGGGEVVGGVVWRSQIDTLQKKLLSKNSPLLGLKNWQYSQENTYFEVFLQ